jgi:hypothetical protein
MRVGIESPGILDDYPPESPAGHWRLAAFCPIQFPVQSEVALK